MHDIMPSGKYKGKSLASLNPDIVQAIWAAWNGCYELRNATFFSVLTARKMYNDYVQEQKRQAHKDKKPAYVIPVGRHSGRSVSQMDNHEIAEVMFEIDPRIQNAHYSQQLQQSVWAKCHKILRKTLSAAQIQRLVDEAGRKVVTTGYDSRNGYVIPHGKYRGKNVKSLKATQIASILCQYKASNYVQGLSAQEQKEIHESALRELLSRDKMKAKPEKPKKSNAEHLADFERDRVPYTMPNGITITVPAGTQVSADEICPFE